MNESDKDLILQVMTIFLIIILGIGSAYLAQEIIEYKNIKQYDDINDVINYNNDTNILIFENSYRTYDKVVLENKNTTQTLFMTGNSAIVENNTTVKVYSDNSIIFEKNY
jgi:hypothetical protein